MSTKQMGGALMLVAAIWFAFQGGSLNLDRFLPDNTPSTPEVQVDQQLKDELTGSMQNVPPGDAMTWAGMLQAMASFVEQDGSTSQPLLVSMDDVAQMVQAATRAPIRPVQGGQQIGAVLGPRLDAIGQAGDPLEGRREQVVSLLKQAGAVLEGI